ncbi:MAG: hypothetical protein ACE5IR_18420 [bacterium]
MRPFTTYFVSGFLISGLLLFLKAVYSLFKHKMNVKVRYFSQLSPEDAASLSDKIIGKYPENSTIYILAGEFNYHFYKKFIPLLYNLIEKMHYEVLVIGGPNISVANKESKKKSDPSEINMVLDAAFKGKIKLFLKSYGRENHHFIVSSKSNNIALLEDPHLEHQQRGSSIIYNSKVYCDNLRHRFENILSKNSDLTVVNSEVTIDSLRPRFKTPEEFDSTNQNLNPRELKSLAKETPWIGY